MSGSGKRAWESIATQDGLPQSLHTEIAILGAMMLDPIAFADATAKLRAEDFSLDSHQKIYRAICDIVRDGYRADTTTVRAELERRHELDAVGGAGYIAYLTEGIPRNFSIESYVRIVREKSLLRWGLEICERAMVRFVDGGEDPLAIFTETQRKLDEAAAEMASEPSLDRQGDDEMMALDGERKGTVRSFVPSGLGFYDRSHGGFARGEMTVIGARPMVGKSTWLRQAIQANCEEGLHVHLFTPEMTAGQVLRRLWALVSNLPVHKVRFPQRMTAAEYELLQLAKQAVAKLRLTIDDATRITAHELIARARRVQQREKTDLLLVDYLQKLRFAGRPEHRHIEVTDAIVSLTAFAKTSGMAVVVVSSLTEGDQKNRNRMPTIADFRQSGDIRYEASTALLLHRDTDTETNRLTPETKLIIGKARSDEDGVRTMYFDGAMQRFVDTETWLRGMGK